MNHGTYARAWLVQFPELEVLRRYQEPVAARAAVPVAG